jgi:uncharacterized phiE125 gp8 family phage protein
MAEPVSLLDARDHLKLDATSGSHPDDGLVQSLLLAARTHVENFTGRVLVEATKDAYFDAFPDDAEGFRLPHGPATAVTWVKYVADDGTLTTLASAVYRLDSDSIRPRLALEDGQSWPSARAVVNAVQIRTTCGGSVDQGLKHAIMLLAAHWYENRIPVGAGSLADMPHMVDALLSPYRIWSLL